MASFKLFVGNLPDSFNDQSLKDLLTDCSGILAADVVRDKYSGRSRGFAIVTMASAGDVQTAKIRLQGRKIGDKPLIVSVARDPFHP